jgi:hypothetical protein
MNSDSPQQKASYIQRGSSLVEGYGFLRVLTVSLGSPDAGMRNASLLRRQNVPASFHAEGEEKSDAGCH